MSYEKVLSCALWRFLVLGVPNVVEAIARYIVLVFLSQIMIGCASIHPIRHSFSFGFPGENSGVEILSYRYGEYQGFPTENSAKAESPMRQNSGVYGILAPGRFLEVAWRNLETGKLVNDRVDLSQLNGDELEDKELHFFIDESGLNVVLLKYRKNMHDGSPCIVGRLHMYRCEFIYPPKTHSN